MLTLIPDDEIEAEEKKWAKIHGSERKNSAPRSETKRESAPAKDEKSGNFVDEDID